MKQSGFFDVEERLARLSGLGDHLEAFSRTMDFEVFRPDLEKAMAYSDGSKGGRPPLDPVLMFKILVIQTLNNLSDERTEYLINDRLSFMRFLGLGLSDRVPDAKTVWLFRDRLTQAGAIDGLFNCFDATLRNAGYLPMSDQILDATLVAAPKQRNTNAEKADLREGRIPQDWQGDCVEFCAVALFQAIGKRSSNMMASWHLTAYHSLTERFHSEEVALSAR